MYSVTDGTRHSLNQRGNYLRFYGIGNTSFNIYIQYDTLCALYK